MSSSKDGSTVGMLLQVVGELLRGSRHSRKTIAAATGKSMATADRWIEQLAPALGLKHSVEGRTTWWFYDGAKGDGPTKPAVVGAIMAASLAAVFAGSEHERNLKDARDYLIRLRGLKYEELDRRFYFAPRGGEYALPDKGGLLDEVLDGLLEGRLLKLSYRHNDGHSEDLVVEPLSLIIFEHQFYVCARKAHVQGAKPYCYRFARIASADATDEKFQYPERNEYDPATLFASNFGIHVSNVKPIEDVKVLLSGAWASYARSHRWHPTQENEPLPDGRVRVSLRVRHCPEIETWVLGFGEACDVESPPELRRTVQDRLARALLVYERPGPSVAKAVPAPRRRPRKPSTPSA